MYSLVIVLLIRPRVPGHFYASALYIVKYRIRSAIYSTEFHSSTFISRTGYIMAALEKSLPDDEYRERATMFRPVLSSYPRFVCLQAPAIQRPPLTWQSRFDYKFYELQHCISTTLRVISYRFRFKLCRRSLMGSKTSANRPPWSVWRNRSSRFDFQSADYATLETPNHYSFSGSLFVVAPRRWAGYGSGNLDQKYWLCTFPWVARLVNILYSGTTA